jgi:tetratricopeptide (TPR) repeat protein
MLSVKPAAVDSGEAADPKAAGQRLGVRYLVLGTLGRDGPDYAGTVRLVEAETGHDVYVRPFRYRPGERTVLTVNIALAVIWSVLLSETERPLPAVPEAGHYAILAFVFMKDLHRSASFAEKALELDRDWVPALLAHSWAQHMLSTDGPPEARSAHLAKAHEAVERAIELAPLNPLAYSRRGRVLRDRGDPFGAIAANQQALKLSPNMSIAQVDIGMNKIAAGLAHETIPHIVEALRLSAKHRWRFKWYLWAGQAAVHTADYEAAVPWLKKAMLGDFRLIDLRYMDVKPWLAVAYAGLGREEEGRALLVEEARERGALTIAAWRQRYPLRSGTVARQRERIEALLRRLGVPEAEKGPDAAKREVAEKAGDPKLAAARNSDAPAARGAFDGTWQVRRVGPGCRWYDKTFEIQVIEGAVSGHRGAGPISGTVTPSGRLAFKHLSSSGDGVSLHYSAALEGAVGSGTFEYPDHPCRGTITLRRIGPRAEPAADR